MDFVALRSRTLTILAQVFNEPVMGLLALVALATALGPMVFEVSPYIEHLLTVVEWVLVGAFAAEFFVEGAVADDFHSWIRSPWRIVDVVTVLGPVVALLPQVTEFARGSLMLRMLRVGRAVAFGTRAGTVAAGKPRLHTHGLRGTPAFSVIAEGESHPIDADWDGFVAWPRSSGPPSWAHGTNLDRARFRDLAHSAGLADQALERLLADNGHGKIREGTRCAALVLQVPSVPDSGFPEVHWDRLLALITDRGLLTAAAGPLALQASLPAEGAPLSNRSFRVRIASALLAFVRDRHKMIIERFEDEYRRLEAEEEGNDLLHGTFRLRHQISAVALDLWHVKGLVRELADGKTKLHGVDLKDETFFDDLAHDMDALHQAIIGIREDLKSLIELHINLKSFEMNRFLKLLAVVSFLGLIPSVAGGLLGMNVAGNPWSVTLGQVTFGVAMTMATAIYVFAVKGWLK